MVWRRLTPILIRAVVLLVIGAWLFWGADYEKLGAAFSRLPAWAVGGAIAVGGLNMVVAGVRWRWLMRGFGAEPLPRVRTLVRLFVVGLFYNTFVPGAVGGDVVRGVVSRRHFDNPTASYVVVVTERLIGLSALGVVFLAGLLLGPELVDTREALPWLLGLFAVGGAVLVGARLSGRLASWWSMVPEVTRWRDLAAAFLISLGGHALNVVIYMLLALGLALPVGVLDLAVIVPLALVASALPISIASLGPREVAVVALLAPLGVAKAEALALSLGYWGVLVSLALTGGLVQLVVTRGSDTSRSSAGGPPPG